VATKRLALTSRSPKLKFLLFTVATIIVGLSAGFVLRQRSQESSHVVRSAEPLQLLSYKGVIDPLLLQEFTKATHVQVEMQEAADEGELWQLFSKMNEEKPFDVVLLSSDQISRASSETRIQPLSEETAPGLIRIAPDFNFIAEKLGVRTLPLLWGLHEHTDEKSSLWVYAFALTAKSKRQRSALIFLDYLTGPAASLSLVNSSHLASTVSSLNNEKIDDKSKPSFLKTIPLSSYNLEGLDLKGTQPRDRH
jgi:spermidine/putrescine-binding protein